MLVSCFACGKRISNRVPACPFCGAAPALPARALPPSAVSVPPVPTVEGVQGLVAPALPRERSDPRNVSAWIAKGVAFSESGRAADAVGCFDEGLRIDPTNPQLWYNKGNALTPLGLIADALACFAETTRLAPQFPTAWYNKGLAEYQLERAGAAVSFKEFLRRAPASDARRAPAQQILSWIASGQRREMRLHAGERVDEAGNAHPDPPPAAAPSVDLEASASPIVVNSALEMLAAMAAALTQSGQHEQAVEVVARWIDAAPQSAAARDAQGQLLAVMGRPREAVAAFERAVALDPRSAAYRTNLGHALAMSGRHEEALAALDTALARDPRMGQAWANRANTLNALKRFDDSIENSDRAIALGVDEAGVHYNKGLSHRARERWEPALAAFDAATARDPAAANAWYFKAEILERLARGAEARASYQQFLSLAPPHLGPQIQEARQRLQQLSAG